MRRGDAGSVLADRFIQMMKATGIPNGLSGLGYSEKDVPALAERAFPLKRLLDNGPRPVGMEKLTKLFENAVRYW